MAGQAIAAPGDKKKFTKKELRDAHVEHCIRQASQAYKDASHPESRKPFVVLDSRGTPDFAEFFSKRSTTLRGQMRSGFRVVDLRTGKVYSSFSDLPA